MKFCSGRARVKEGAAGSDLVERTFAKQPESASDELVKCDPQGDLWRDWSDEVQVVDG